MPAAIKALLITIAVLIILIIAFPAFGDFINAAGIALDHAADSIRDNFGWTGWGPPSTR